MNCNPKWRCQWSSMKCNAKWWGHCKSMITQIRDQYSHTAFDANNYVWIPAKWQPWEQALQVILPDEADLRTIKTDVLIQPTVQRLHSFSKPKARERVLQAALTWVPADRKLRRSTEAVWPSKVFRQVPSANAHSRNVLSPEAWHAWFLLNNSGKTRLMK